MPASAHARPPLVQGPLLACKPSVARQAQRLGGPGWTWTGQDLHLFHIHATSTRERKNHLGFYSRDTLKSYSVPIFFFLILGSVPETKTPIPLVISYPPAHKAGGGFGNLQGTAKAK